MADVFLSYARPNARIAKQAAKALRQQGYTVWFDENLPAHRAYSEVIEEQLEAARAECRRVAGGRSGHTFEASV